MTKPKRRPKSRAKLYLVNGEPYGMVEILRRCTTDTKGLALNPDTVRNRVRTFGDQGRTWDALREPVRDALKRRRAEAGKYFARNSPYEAGPGRPAAT